ncbi:hypothetical protein VNI00_004603 [Paramarasmius palmivorus]|uniref:F-box domain-containing protein n=1 Tax=Paramarasmius palmivorus TaxID=297713 RepID=A0AAW0DKL9_9AGAR
MHCTQSNSYISLLPNEILREIFKYFIPVSPEDNFRLTLSQICGHWRAIACGLQQLWTYPDFQTPELAKEMLKRLGGAPLHIQFIHAEHTRKTHRMLPSDLIISRTELLYQTFRQASHLETVNLDMPSSLMQELAARHVHTAPALRSLYLFSDGCDLSPDFMGGNAPLLTRLVLDGCGLAYNSPLLHNLTSLDLTGSQHETSFARRLCEALRFMPMLECLDLDEVYCDDPEDSVIAELPKLRRIGLHCTDLSGATIFNHISFPTTTFVQVEVSYPEPPEDVSVDDIEFVWSGIGRMLSPRYFPGGERIIKALAVDGDVEYEGLSFTLKAWDTIPPFDSIIDDRGHLPIPNLHITVDWSERDRESPTFFEWLFKAAIRAFKRLPVLEILRLGAFPRYSENLSNLLIEALEPHLWSTPVHTLIFHVEHAAADLAEMLVYQPDNKPLPLSKLETLVFTYFDFDHQLVEGLYKSLRTRMRQGMKLKKNVVRASENDSGSNMDLFERVVEELDWDFDYTAGEDEDEESDEDGDQEESNNTKTNSESTESDP